LSDLEVGKPKVTNSKRNWNSEEDKRLQEITQTMNTSSINWGLVAQYVQTKNSSQCSYRYNKLMKKDKKVVWNRCEDIKLLELIETKGTSNFQDLTQYFPGKTELDIFERYKKKLDPQLKKSKFDTEEDALIVKLHNEYGNKWNDISKFFKDRTATMIKNRYYSFLKSKIEIKPIGIKK